MTLRPALGLSATAWTGFGFAVLVAAANLILGRLPRKPAADGAWVDTTVGVRLHYREQNGSDPPVIFIHGMPGISHDYDAIAERLPGRRTIAIDRPGYGHSRGGPRDLAGQTATVRDLLDALGIERAVLAGHSFGGLLALSVAASHPDRVAALVLVAPAGGGTRVAQKRLRQARVVRILQASGVRQIADIFFLRALRRLAAEQGVRAAYGSDTELEETRRRAVAVLAQHDDISALMSDRLMFNDAERAMTAALGAITAPTIVVHGSRDTVVPVRRGERIAEAIPGAELRVTDGDHVLPVRRPDIVACAIEDIYARIEPQ